jgi:hypothetical protein
MHVKEQIQSLKTLFGAKEHQQRTSKTYIVTIFPEVAAKTAQEALFRPPENQTNDLQNSSKFIQIIYVCQRTKPKFKGTVWNQEASTTSFQNLHRDHLC